ncbi:glucose transporter type 1-like [Oppia nitens]|uniref:glucose transporter type 1-like n=1 Tax=Oppia nitens TaxID=1686743 RepID=UPI0023DA93AE|nr:glucose transporter type 1-like [Oppia nitens]
MISCGITRHLMLCLLSVVLSSFINGINQSVRESSFESIFRFTNRVIHYRILEEKQMSNPGKDLEKIYKLDDHSEERLKDFKTLWSTSYLISIITGAIIGGYMADKVGRKKGLIWSNIFIFIAAFFTSFSYRFGSYEMIIIGQILVGANIGINSCLAPIYLSEVSPIRLRGIFSSVYVLGTGLALVISQSVITIFKLENWVYMFSSVIIPSILMLFIINECPESPKFSFILRGDHTKGQTALQKLRENSEVNDELYEMKVEYQLIQRSQRLEFQTFLNDYKLRNALLISMTVSMSQHLTGITSVPSFAKSVYKDLSLSERSQSYISIALLTISFKISLIFAILVERLGRRTLLLMGLLGVFCALIFLSFCIALRESLDVLNHLNIITLFVYIILYSCGPSFIPNFYFVELFRTDCRSIGATISVVTLYIVPLIISISFISFETNLESYVAAVFAVLTLILWIIIYKTVPETKGKTIEEIIYEL